MTAATDAPWVAVDFGSTVSVNSVEVTNRGEGVGYRFNYVFVHMVELLPQRGDASCVISIRNIAQEIDCFNKVNRSEEFIYGIQRQKGLKEIVKK